MLELYNIETNNIEDLIQQKLEARDISRVILVDSVLSGNRIELFLDSWAIINEWLTTHNYRLISQKKFDYDEFARIKRKFINRPFPEYRTIIYVYSK